MLPQSWCKVRNALFFRPFSMAVAAALILLTGCLSWFGGGDREKDADEGPFREEYRLGHVKKNSFPLPSMTPVYLDQLRGNRRISSRLVYRGWDMNEDGRFDMLESLDPEGRVLFRAYDLDFDGVVDEVEKINQEADSPAPGASLRQLLPEKDLKQEKEPIPDQL